MAVETDLGLSFLTIQDAIDSLPVTGGKVFIYPGTYNETLVIDNKSNVCIEGSGVGNTIINTNGVNAAGITIRGTAGESNYVENVEVSGLSIVCNDNDADNLNFGVDVVYAKNLKLRNILTQNAFYGFKMRDVIDSEFFDTDSNGSRSHAYRIEAITGNASCRDLNFYNCNIDETNGVGQGFYVYGGVEVSPGTWYLPHRINIFGGTIKNTAEAGTRIEGNYCTIINVNTERTGRHGHRSSGERLGGAGNKFIGCDILEAGQNGTDFNGIYFDDRADTVYDCVVDNCYVRRSKGHGIAVQGTRRLKISNTVVEDSGADSGFTVFDGILLNAGGAAPVSIYETSIINCTFKDTRTGASRTQDYGIEPRIDASTVIEDLKIIGNTFNNNIRGAFDPELSNYCEVLEFNSRPDQWVAINETWGYASSNRVTVPAGAASRFAVGQKVKFNNPVTKHFEIVGVEDTALTLQGFGVEVANATITEPFFSAAEFPIGTEDRDVFAENLLVNGSFELWQRNFTFTDPTAASYTSDRWKVEFDVDGGTAPTLIHSKQTPSSGSAFGTNNMYRIAVDGAGVSFGANSYYQIVNHIEKGVRYYAGKNKFLRVRVIAKSTVADKKIGIYLRQNYGTGGAPSATEIINGTNFDLTASFQTFEYTFELNDLTGKTYGTDEQDHLDIVLQHQWGANNAARVGASSAEDWGGSGNIDVILVFITPGARKYIYQSRSAGAEFDLAQRYYERSTGLGIYNFNSATSTPVSWVTGIANEPSPQAYFATPKRTNTPTVTIYSAGTSTAGQVRNVSDGADVAGAVGNTSNKGFNITPTVGTSKILEANWEAEDEF